MTATDINRFLARPLIWLVRGYQLLVSPLLPPSCRYYPSCSAYAVEALRVHGLFRGSWLAARRLARCHPWTAGGVDHVPAAAGTRAVPDHQVSSGSPRT
ncbi:MAG TPA: membrane protein insertion efficiency factor YidD [Ornithinicoccus sp.]|jgi:hypothetical protein|nr:membrane protein insertion efficiency factor YidD [Ornithinicoccus sp.]